MRKKLENMKKIEKNEKIVVKSDFFEVWLFRSRHLPSPKHSKSTTQTK